MCLPYNYFTELSKQTEKLFRKGARRQLQKLNFTHKIMSRKYFIILSSRYSQTCFWSFYVCFQMSLTRLSGLQCYSMGHNGHGINLYSVVMILRGNLHAGGQSNPGHFETFHQKQMYMVLYNVYTKLIMLLLQILNHLLPKCHVE